MSTHIFFNSPLLFFFTSDATMDWCVKARQTAVSDRSTIYTLISSFPQFLFTLPTTVDIYGLDMAHF